MNQNEVAVEISKKEGKKVEVNIAQIKEIIRLYNNLIKEKTSIDVAEILRRSL